MAREHSYFSNLPTYKYDFEFESWKEATVCSHRSLASIDRSKFTIVTLNVLFDSYFEDKIHTRKRFPFILDLLQKTDADIIGLQEVTQTFLIELLRQDWVKKEFYVSDNQSGMTVYPYGQLLLSKMPFRLFIHRFSSFKKVVLGEFVLNHRKMYVSVVHLTSDKAASKMDTAQKRAYQLNKIYEKIALKQSSEEFSTDCLLMGDFNFNSEDEEKLIPSDFIDVWKNLRPNDPGYTFDPQTNIMAQTISMLKVQRRFDRIYLRTPGTAWKMKDIELFATEPFSVSIDTSNTTNISDHSQNNSLSLNNTNNLDIQKDNPEKKLLLYASDHYGLRCVLEFNPNLSSNSIPEDVERKNLVNVQNNIENVIQSSKDSQLESDLESEFSYNLKALLSVGTIQRILQENDCFETSQQMEQRQHAVEVITQAFMKFFSRYEKSDHKMVTLGSYRLGIVSPSSDIDLLCIGHLKHNQFLHEASNFFQQSNSEFKDVVLERVVSIAIAPLLKFKVFGFEIDLTYCHLIWNEIPENFNVLTVDELTLKKLDNRSFVSLSGHRDTEFLIQHIPNLETFRIVAHFIRFWTQRRCLYSNTLGFFGGIALYVMITRICQLFPDASPEFITIKFFETYATWNWLTNCVSVISDSLISYKVSSSSKSKKTKERIVILTPTKPHKNITRNITRTTARIIENELRQAHVTIQNFVKNNLPVQWNEILNPYEEQFFKYYPSFLQVTISAITKEEFLQWEGYIESNLVSLIAKLEKDPKLLVHPLPTSFQDTNSNYPFSIRFFIGIVTMVPENGSSMHSDENMSIQMRNHPKNSNTKKIDIDHDGVIQEFENSCSKWFHKTDGMSLQIKKISKENLKEAMNWMSL